MIDYKITKSCEPLKVLRIFGHPVLGWYIIHFKRGVGGWGVRISAKCKC